MEEAENDVEDDEEEFAFSAGFHFAGLCKAREKFRVTTTGFILGDAIKRGRGGRQGRTQNALAIVYRSGGKHAAAAGSIGNSKSFHRTPKYDV